MQRNSRGSGQLGRPDHDHVNCDTRKAGFPIASARRIGGVGIGVNSGPWTDAALANWPHGNRMFTSLFENIEHKIG